MKIAFLLVLSTSTLFFLVPLFVRAGSGVTITPAFQEIVIARDQREAVFEIVVMNASEAALTIRLGVLDIGQLNDSGGVALLGREAAEVERSYGLAGWLKLDRDLLVMEPQQQQTLKATIVNQESLSPGGHYAAVIGYIEVNKADQVRTSDSVVVKSAFSTLIFVKKEGGERYQLDLRRVTPLGTWLKLPHSTTLYWRNGGNVHVVPRGVITITDPLGRKIAQGSINESSFLIFPEAFRTMAVPMRRVASTFLPGLYRLRVEYRYDGREDMSIHEEPILFIGWIGALGMVAMGGMSGAGMWRFIRRSRKKRTQ